MRRPLAVSWIPPGRVPSESSLHGYTRHHVGACCVDFCMLVWTLAYLCYYKYDCMHVGALLEEPVQQTFSREEWLLLLSYHKNASTETPAHGGHQVSVPPAHGQCNTANL